MISQAHIPEWTPSWGLVRSIIECNFLFLLLKIGIFSLDQILITSETIIMCVL